MNCPTCNYTIKVKTDPENSDYKFILGAKRIFKTEEATDGRVIDQKVQKLKFVNPFARLEGKIDDERKKNDERPRIQSIIDLNESRWKDDYAANSLLRKRFRKDKGKKVTAEAAYGVKMEELSDFDKVILNFSYVD